MDCRTFHRKLEDYLEGGMDFPARFGMERHASRCYSCERDVAVALKLRQMAHDLKTAGASPEFEVALLARIREQKSRHRFWRLESIWLYGFDGASWRTVGAAALTALLAVGTLSVLYWSGVMVDPPGMQAAADPGAIPPDAAISPWPGLLPAGGEMAAGRPATLGANVSARSLQDDWAMPYADPADSDYFELLVPVSGDRQLIMRLPKTIRMRYAQASREYFIRNVSH